MSAEELQQQQGGGLPSGGAYGLRTPPPDIVREQNQVGNRAVQYNPNQQGGGAFLAPSLPKIPWGTEPTYDTLPGNSDRFIFTGHKTITGNVKINAELFTYTAPAGRVLYLTKAKVNVINTFPPVCSGEPATLGIPQDLISFSVFRNQATSPFDANITEEPLDSYYPVFVIFGPGDVLSLRVSYDYTVNFYTIGSVEFLFSLTGDVLQVNDMPPQYTALKNGAASG